MPQPATAAPARPTGKTVAVLLDEAVALHRAGRLADAAKIYRQILTIEPDHFACLHMLGVISAQSGEYEEAVEQIGAALSLNANHLNALSNLGNAQLALSRCDDALASYDRALALQPDLVVVRCNRGNALHVLNRYSEALESYDRVLSLQPDHVEALVNRGVTLLALERFEEALASCDRALAFDADSAEGHFNRGLALHRMKRFADALASYDRALAVRPDYAQAHYNCANTLLAMGRFEAALAGYDRAIALGTDHAEAHSNRGVALDKLMRFDAALASYQRAVALRPDFADAHYNEALCRLLIGDFRRGWDKHEWRWETGQSKQAKRNFAQPLWLGDGGLAGKTILLHAEQGFGDTIQFCRYAPLVAERAAQVILDVQEPLRDLMRTLAGAPRIAVRGEPLPDFDLHCPLLSLPLALRTELAAIPSAVPYLQALPDAVTHWGGRLPPTIRPRVGLVWSGRPTHLNDHNRSIPIDVFLSALSGIDASYVSLQREFRAGDVAHLRERGGVTCFGEDLQNFADTAALIENLDLVISMDTSVAHLAGALAKPVWILLPYNPDWRWLLNRHDSPWYPTARLFRQDRSRAWDGAMERVHAELRNFVRGL
jgi:tetratricopeptide (TPR) repeat protein